MVLAARMSARARVAAVARMCERVRAAARRCTGLPTAAPRIGADAGAASSWAWTRKCSVAGSASSCCAHSGRRVVTRRLSRRGAATDAARAFGQALERPRRRRDALAPYAAHDSAIARPPHAGAAAALSQRIPARPRSHHPFNAPSAASSTRRRCSSTTKATCTARGSRIRLEVAQIARTRRARAAPERDR